MLSNQRMNRLEKQQVYESLVKQRKQCRLCSPIGLTNPAIPELARLDAPHIGAWTRWLDDLSADLMIVGQDWGPVDLFIHQNGLDKDIYTNRALTKLLAQAGIPVEPAPIARSNSRVFATNAVLCLKQDGTKSKVSPACFDHCGPNFLLPQIQLVRPKVVVALGQAAYRAIMKAFGLEATNFQTAVDSPQPVELMPGTCLIPVYLCTRLVMNTHRTEKQQQADWLRVAAALEPKSFAS